MASELFNHDFTQAASTFQSPEITAITGDVIRIRFITNDFSVTKWVEIANNGCVTIEAVDSSSSWFSGGLLSGDVVTFYAKGIRGSINGVVEVAQ